MRELSTALFLLVLLMVPWRSERNFERPSPQILVHVTSAGGLLFSMTGLAVHVMSDLPLAWRVTLSLASVLPVIAMVVAGALAVRELRQRGASTAAALVAAFADNESPGWVAQVRRAEWPAMAMQPATTLAALALYRLL